MRWLRPAYQVPRLGARVRAPQEEMDVGTPLSAGPAPLSWPAEPRAQFGAVRALLDAAASPLTPEDVARAFKGRPTKSRRKRTADVLAILADMGHARAPEGEARYAARR